MPVTKQAIKKVRQDRRKTVFNARVKKNYKKVLSDYKKTPSAAGLTKVFSALDSAAKTNVIHKNTASRLKSRLSKLVKGSASAPKKEVQKKKPTSKKPSK